MVRLRDEARSYTNGAEGMIRWCEEKVCVPIYPPGSDVVQWCSIGDLPSEVNPDTNKSYKTIWEEQKVILREALRMEKGRFFYRLIVLCWMRGEGKSLLACLIQLWKFFCFPRQQIMLGANSKDQVKFVHYDIMRDIISNSPLLLLQIGRKNIQEKEIRLKDRNGKLQSLIRSISSFSGIVSNITGYTFSEIFDMKNPRFFVQLDGSIRTMPNALGVIDSTVSEKTHVLYQLYHAALTGETRAVFFSYRYSVTGRQEDYWNPNMDDSQLQDYKVKFPFGEFERYFLNLWSAGHIQVFTDEMIEETGILGWNGVCMNHRAVKEQLDKKYDLLQKKQALLDKKFTDGVAELMGHVEEINSHFIPLESVLRLKTRYNTPQCATIEMLEELGDKLDTHWAVGVGVDLADPMATRSNARTVFTLMAKGLVGSKSSPFTIYDHEQAVPRYCYFLLHALVVEKHQLEFIKGVIDEVGEEFDGVDVFCGERWGIWDMEDWCSERAITFDPIYPTYDRQREAFKELFTIVDEGRLKIPPLAVPGSKQEDIWREEASIFDHDPEKRWFGSPEKSEKYGIQDDFIYAIAWSIYGMRFLTPDDFRARKSSANFGIFIQNSALAGKY